MSGEDDDSREPTALLSGRGQGGGRAENFLRGSVITRRESSQVGGLGSTMESDIVHGPSAFVFLLGIAKNLRHHNRPIDIKAYDVQFNNPSKISTETNLEQ